MRMKINKKGTVTLILCAVYISIFISGLYILLNIHLTKLERKNNIDFAMTNVSTIPSSMLITNYSEWKTIFNQLLEENCNNKDINFMYMLKKENDKCLLYDLTNSKERLITSDFDSSYMFSYIKNNTTIDKIQDFITSSSSNLCLIINKDINSKQDKDYFIKFRNNYLEKNKESDKE